MISRKNGEICGDIDHWTEPVIQVNRACVAIKKQNVAHILLIFYKLAIIPCLYCMYTFQGLISNLKMWEHLFSAVRKDDQS